MGRRASINLVDTPGHADFGGEVERALALVDGVLLLVDAAEGPLPQTRYVLSKALAAGAAGRRGAQQGRPPGRPGRRGARRGLPAVPRPRRRRREHRVPGRSRPSPGRAGPWPASACPAPDDDLTAAVRGHRRHDPRSRPATPTAPLQAIVTNLDASDYLGRLAIGRVMQGTLRKGDQVALLDEEVDEGQKPARAQARPRSWASRASAGSTSTSGSPATCSSSAGFPEVEIGDTIADPADPEAAAAPQRRRAGAAHDLRREHLAAGRQGGQLPHLAATCASASTARCSATCRSGWPRPTSPDVIEVAGRGELQLAVLIEAHAPRGLRAPGQPARGHRPGDRRQAPRAARAGA